MVAATQPEILVPAALLVGATAGIYFAYHPQMRVLAGVLTSLELIQKWRSAVDVDPELYEGLIDNYNKVQRADKTGDCTELIKALEEQHIKFLDSIQLDTVDNNQQ